jgi:hypothetical protein
MRCATVRRARRAARRDINDVAAKLDVRHVRPTTFRQLLARSRRARGASIGHFTTAQMPTADVLRLVRWKAARGEHWYTDRYWFREPRAVAWGVAHPLVGFAQVCNGITPCWTSRGDGTHFDLLRRLALCATGPEPLRELRFGHECAGKLLQRRLAYFAPHTAL